MHNVVRKVLLIIVAVLIALFAYKIIKTPNLTSPTVSVDNKNQKASDAQLLPTQTRGYPRIPTADIDFLA